MEIKTPIPPEVLNAEVIFVNHSGGKDSQAMLAYLQNLQTIGFMGKMVVLHADLGEMEWEPMHDFIVKNSFGLEVNVVRSELDFFDICRKYKRLPSGLARFCTSMLKTAPCSKFIKEYCEKNGIKRAINAMGIRAEESLARSKKVPFKKSKLTHIKKGLEVYEWYPIFDFDLNQVWTQIRLAKQVPHEVYSKGFSRLSCVFCVFGRIEEHKKAATMKPELYQKMVALEADLGKSIRLKQVDGVKVNKFLPEYC